jgi:hypothetical protein
MYAGYKSPQLKICNFGEAKMINLFNTASIYIIHRTNKFLNNTWRIRQSGKFSFA